MSYMRRKISYIIYKRIRPAIGLPLGFILMYGAFVNNITIPLLLTGTAFVLIEIYGGFYNDYWDYDEDLRNKREDKFIASGILNRGQVKSLAFTTLAAAIFLLLFTNIFVLIVALYCITLFVSYSHPKIRLKGNIRGYLIISTIFFFIPISLNTLLLPEFFLPTLLFSTYCFFQFMYILCQKDSTDLKDKKNIFLTHGWKKSSRITSVFGILASLSLLSICLFNPILVLVWLFNAISKSINMDRIRRKAITRSQRSRLILLEFITPYLYVAGVLL